MTPSEYAAFLDSLKVKNEGPEEMHGWKFSKEIKYLTVALENTRKLTESHEVMRMCEFIEYLIERIRRAESNAKSPTLLEDVKACVRAAMEATVRNDPNYPWQKSDYDEFRKLSEVAP